MENIKKRICGFLLLVLILSGCSKKQVDINILATTDLHSIVPDEMVEYVDHERKKDENLTVVDAGDFFDIKDPKMKEWFFQPKALHDDNNFVYSREGEAPIVKNMNQLKYDAIVLGNHEFVSNTKSTLDELISDYEKYNMNILSANTYKSNGQNYIKPYIIKEVATNQGTIRLGILGLTIKEVGESTNGSRELKDLPGFKNELYMNDLVEDAKKWVKVIQEKENTDIIVAVAHTGERPKKPRNPGNRIQDLAQDVEGIDAIVAGHTHVAFNQHDYKTKSGKNVIVTQPGKNGEHISKINLKVVNKNGKWEVKDKSSNLIKF